MSLRAFHLLFIVMSVILTAFFAAWAFGQYRTEGAISYALTAAGSLAAGIGLVVYAAGFLKKTKRLS
jgi:hypothetical protein